jgi:hypothetical protein
MPTKTCQTCKTPKPSTDFYRKARSPDGLQGECKACQRITNARNKSNRLGPSKIAKPPKPAPKVKAESPKTVLKDTRYSIVRNVSRKTGEASWGILDSHSSTNAVCFVGDNLKDTLLECNRLNQPKEKIPYTRHGMVGYIDPDAE